MKYFFLLSFVLLTPLFVFAAEAGQFVPLTSLPGLVEGGQATTMTVFLNNLYKICIGAAAAIAVLQIIRAGILFMTNKGSISENEQARSLVQGAVLGLLLVLSPVIVFTIINPKILTLDFGVGALKQEKPADVDLGSSVAQSTAEDIAAVCGVTTNACVNDGATKLQTTYLSCAKAAAHDPAKLDACSKSLVDAGTALASSCLPDLSATDKTCIGQKLAAAAQAAVSAELAAALDGIGALLGLSGEAVQAVINMVLSKCGLTANPTQTLCLVGEADSVADEYVSCLNASGGLNNPAGVAACVAQAKSRASTSGEKCLGVKDKPEVFTAEKEVCVMNEMVDGIYLYMSKQ